MATSRERAKELIDEYTIPRALQIADTMICVCIGRRKVFEKKYWEDIYDFINDISVENTQP